MVSFPEVLYLCWLLPCLIDISSSCVPPSQQFLKSEASRNCLLLLWFYFCSLTSFNSTLLRNIPYLPPDTPSYGIRYTVLNAFFFHPHYGVGAPESHFLLSSSQPLLLLSVNTTCEHGKEKLLSSCFI